MAVTLLPEPLQSFARSLLTAAGATRPEADRVAESLVGSNLRGHDSHGVVRVREYAEAVERGDLVVGAELTTLHQTDALLATDARFGFGQVQAARLVERLIPMAERQGVACGTMSRSGHVGRLGEWVELVAQQELAGLIAVNDNGVLKCVAPPDGIEPRISTNPLAIGVPTGDGPLVLDISTSVVANGKINVARLAGALCPPGWLLDADGNPTTDPNARFTDPPGSILPVGGTHHGYKGFGLGLLFDILVSGLSGGFCPPAPADAPEANNVLLVVWNPARAAGSDHFQREADKLVDFVRQTEPRSGVERITLPGDRSRRTLAHRTKHGVPLDSGTWQRLVELASRLDVPLP